MTSVVAGPVPNTSSDFDKMTHQEKMDFCRGKLICLGKMLTILNKHDCFDDVDKEWVQLELTTTQTLLAQMTAELDKMTARETRVMALEHLLATRTEVLNQIDSEVHLSMYCPDLIKQFAQKQVELIAMLRTE